MNRSWRQIRKAVRNGEPVAVCVSPEIYHEQVEFMQGLNSAYVSTEPEYPRLPWMAIEGIPVIVNPNMKPDQFALINTRDWIDDMRVALDIYTDGMLDSHTVTYRIARRYGTSDE